MLGGPRGLPPSSPMMPRVCLRVVTQEEGKRAGPPLCPSFSARVTDSPALLLPLSPPRPLSASSAGCGDVALSRASQLWGICVLITSLPSFLSLTAFFSPAVAMSETLALRGVLKGHENWVTSIATPLDNSDILLSSSRDKSVILWTLTREDAGAEGNYGYPRRSLRGHSHFVQDVVISSDGQARVFSPRFRLCSPCATHRTRLCTQLICSSPAEGQSRGWRQSALCRAPEGRGVLQSGRAHAASWGRASCRFASTRNARRGSAMGKALCWRSARLFFQSRSSGIDTQTAHGVSGRDELACLIRLHIFFFFSPPPQFCLSGSWDGTLRLWDLNTGTTTRRFVGHTKDVLSVAFSVDNRQARRSSRIIHSCLHIRSVALRRPPAS